MAANENASSGMRNELLSFLNMYAMGGNPIFLNIALVAEKMEDDCKKTIS